jgi:cell division septum initiation protein DivIVA
VDKKNYTQSIQKVSDIKRQIKKLEKDIGKAKESLKVISEFESKSEAYFFQEMTPRLKIYLIRPVTKTKQFV